MEWRGRPPAGEAHPADRPGHRVRRGPRDRDGRDGERPAVRVPLYGHHRRHPHDRSGHPGGRRGGAGPPRASGGLVGAAAARRGDAGCHPGGRVGNGTPREWGGARRSRPGGGARGARRRAHHRRGADPVPRRAAARLRLGARCARRRADRRGRPAVAPVAGELDTARARGVGTGRTTARHQCRLAPRGGVVAGGRRAPSRGGAGRHRLRAGVRADSDRGADGRRAGPGGTVRPGSRDRAVSGALDRPLGGHTPDRDGRVATRPGGRSRTGGRAPPRGGRADRRAPRAARPQCAPFRGGRTDR